MKELKFSLETLSTPPTPPTGNAYDHLVNCDTNLVVVYGSRDGDTNIIEFIAQEIKTSVNTITGFGMQIQRHGTPSQPLIIGITRGTPPEDPFDTSSWDFSGSISPSSLPSADTPYWLYAQTSITNAASPSVWLIAVTDADYNANSYWAWYTCGNVQASEGAMQAYGVKA